MINNYEYDEYEEFEYSEEDLEILEENETYIDDIMLHEFDIENQDFIDETIKDETNKIKNKNLFDSNSNLNQIELKKTEELIDIKEKFLSSELLFHVEKYISENNDFSKNFIEDNIEDLIVFFKEKYKENNKKEICFRIWEFYDSEILNLILFNKPIKIEKSGFLSYYSKPSKTKEVFKYLSYEENEKLFYFIEKKLDINYPIIELFKNRNENILDYELNSKIEETIENYKEEDERIILNIEEYNINIKNIKGLIIHKRLFKLLNILEYIKISTKYYYIEININNINKIRKSSYINYLYHNLNIIDKKGAFLLDKFYKKNLRDEIEEINKEKEKTKLEYKKILKAKKF